MTTRLQKKRSRLSLMRDVLLVCLAIPALFVLSFGPALLQEKDTFSVLWTAAQMKMTGATLGHVGSSQRRWLLRAQPEQSNANAVNSDAENSDFGNSNALTSDAASNDAASAYAPLESFMKRRGWIHRGQEGPVGVFDRLGKRIYVRYKKYSPKYILCQADRQP